MIPVPTGIRVWIAAGHTDMRRGMNGLSLLVQEGLKRDPFAGDLYVFRGRRGDLLKCLWHDGLGLSLYSKRLDRGRFAVTTHGVRSLSERRQAPIVPSTVLNVPAPEMMRAVATTVRTAASPLADHMAR